MLNENINNLSPITEIETETEIKTETPVTPIPKEPKNIKIHTPDFIYITGDQQKDEENLQNIISRSSGSLAKHSNSTITQKEFQRRFLLEKEAHKDFYGTNLYINAMHDNFIKKSILNRLQQPEFYNTPEAIETNNLTGYKPAYEDPNLQPLKYASNTLPPTLTDTVVDNEVRIKINNAYNDTFLKRNGGKSLQEIYFASFENGKLIQDAPSNSEGGYIHNSKDRGGETNMGITQKTLDEYKNTYQSSYKSNIPLPKSVKPQKK